MKLIDHNSPEKALLKDAFNSLSYMDLWVCSIIEGYIYKKIDWKKPYERKWFRYGYREEFTLRYNKIEGELKGWWDNGQLMYQYYFKGGRREGEGKMFYENGQIEYKSGFKRGKESGEWSHWYYNGQQSRHGFYKKNKLEGEYKRWYLRANDVSDNNQLEIQCYYKKDKKEGECKIWNEEGELVEHKIYENDEVVKDLLLTELIL